MYGILVSVIAYICVAIISLFRKSKALGVIDQSNNKHMGVYVFHHRFSIQCSLFPQGLCCGVVVGNGLFPFGEQRPALHRFRSG